MASRRLLLISLYLVSFIAAIYAQKSFIPASIPLAVRSPYFSIWYNSSAGAQPLPESWTLFWRGPVIGWTGRIRVDGLTYSWMGNDGVWNNTANVTDMRITPTRTVFAMQAGPMNLTVTFLSPIEPSDWVNQSIPFSYVSVEAQSLDGAAHDVQMYSDITPELVTGLRPNGIGALNPGDPVSWQGNRTSRTFYHETQPQVLQQVSENWQQAEDGRGYYAMIITSNFSYEINTDDKCRHQFADFGKMTNTQSTSFGPIGDPLYAFALAVDLGTIQSTSSPVTWAIGYVRDPAIQYLMSSGATDLRRPYWTTRYSDIRALIDDFVADYAAAHDRAVAFDQRIMADAAQISPQYVDLISLVTRQVMGALDITVPGGSGQGVMPDPADVMVFMKDIRYSQRTSPVERMFAAFPAYLYFNASLGGALLAPLLEREDSQTGQPYATQDLAGGGPSNGYPNATTTSPIAQQGVEQSGNMLIMMYAHARVSGDGSLLSRHYDTAKRWAEYLISNTLTPINQISADSLAYPNMTNLAIKGIIGVQAMAEISRALQRTSDAVRYDTQAKDLASRWLSLAQSSDRQHLLGQYGEESSSALLYNIYADVLLGTNLISQDVLSKQTQYYSTLLQSAWTLFTAATVTDAGVRDHLIQLAWERAALTKMATVPNELPDIYNGVTGESQGGGAGPALGAIFSHLALTVPNTTIVVGDSPLGTPGSSPGAGGGPGDGAGTTRGSNHMGEIVGGAVGGAVLLVIAAGAGFFFWHRSQQQRSGSHHYKDNSSEPRPYPYEVPYDRDYDNPNQDMEAASTNVATYTVSPPHERSSCSVSISSKDRQLAREMEQHQPLYVTPLAKADVSTPPASLHVTSSQPMESSSERSGHHSVATTDLVGLRVEMENLRRLVHGIRQERIDPPPQYRD